MKTRRFEQKVDNPFHIETLRDAGVRRDTTTRERYARRRARVDAANIPASPSPEIRHRTYR